MHLPTVLFAGAPTPVFPQKGRAPLEALPCRPPIRWIECCLHFRSSAGVNLSFQSAIRLARPIITAVGQEVSRQRHRLFQSIHETPPQLLTRNIDSHVTTQVRVGIVTPEVGFTGIYMSFIPVVCIILSSIFGHGITSLVGR